MSRFAIRNPYFIVVVCLIIAVVGVTSLVRMPVDMFPVMNIPVVVVATFYNGMPPEQIETDITGRFERFFTLGSGIEHIESRSLPGVSVIKVYFQPGTNPDSAVTHHLQPGDGRAAPPAAGHAAAGRAEVRRLEPARLPGHAQGRRPRAKTQLRDIGQFTVRNQVAERAGRLGAAAVRRQVPPDHGLRRPVQAGGAPAQPHGRGPRRERLQPDSARRRRAHRPARLQASTPTASSATWPDINRIAAQDRRAASVVLVGDVGDRQGRRTDPEQHRARGRPALASICRCCKQGGDTNTIAVVDGVKDVVANLLDVPKELVARRGLRPIALRQERHRDAAARGRASAWS